MVRLTATEVARSLSAVMNRVSQGEEIQIVRNGVAIAELRPPSAPATVSAARWRQLVATAPGVDDDFAADVEQARREIGPPVSAWPS